MLLLWNIIYLCFVCVMFSSLFIVALWSPTGKGLTSWLSCIWFFFVCFVTYPCDVLGQVWCLIVSILDLCLLSHFCMMVFFIFIQILMEPSISKQWIPWSNAASCGVWSGHALFADVPQWCHVYMGLYFWVQICASCLECLCKWKSRRDRCNIQMDRHNKCVMDIRSYYSHRP